MHVSCACLPRSSWQVTRFDSLQHAGMPQKSAKYQELRWIGEAKKDLCLAFGAQSIWEHGAGLFVNSAWSSANDWGLEKYVRLSCQGLTCFTKNKEGLISSTLQYRTRLPKSIEKTWNPDPDAYWHLLVVITQWNVVYSTDALCEAKLYFHRNKAEETREKHTILYK